MYLGTDCSSLPSASAVFIDEITVRWQFIHRFVDDLPEMPQELVSLFTCKLVCHRMMTVGDNMLADQNQQPGHLGE